jgi:hypothetical protein
VVVDFWWRCLRWWSWLDGAEVVGSPGSGELWPDNVACPASALLLRSLCIGLAFCSTFGFSLFGRPVFYLHVFLVSWMQHYISVLI